MDPIQQIAPLQPAFPVFFAGIFESNEDRDKYLNSLDSDTRDYVLKHTDEFSTRSELMDCVKNLHGKS